MVSQQDVLWRNIGPIAEQTNRYWFCGTEVTGMARISVDQLPESQIQVRLRGRKDWKREFWAVLADFGLA